MKRAFEHILMSAAVPLGELAVIIGVGELARRFLGS